jgi:protein ImuB
VERLLAIWCPGILEEQEQGREARVFGEVVAALEAFATRVDPVRPGVCAVPTRGPSRYFGGDEVLARMAAEAVAGVGAAEAVAEVGAAEAVAGVGAAEAVAGVGAAEAGVGIADGLFAAVLAARAALGAGSVIVPPGGTPSFLGPWPVAALDRPELADLLVRLGIHTLGGFAALPGPQVLARFGGEGALCQRVALGVEGELPGFRLFFPRVGPGPAATAVTRQGGFWGDTADTDARAARAVAGVQELLGPESVVRGRLQGGRGPAQRARLVPWTGPAWTSGSPDGARPGQDNGAGGGSRGPWPGQVPPPAPAVVLTHPLPAQLIDGDGRAVGVTGDGMATGDPTRLSVAGEAWAKVTGWAGPWPSDERWWSVRGRRRQARMQVVTAGAAHLLTRERGGWWLEATYD